jgi:hypothetical protein
MKKAFFVLMICAVTRVMAEETNTLKLFNGTVVTGRVERLVDGGAKVTTTKGIRNYSVLDVSGTNGPSLTPPSSYPYYFGEKFSDEELNVLHGRIIREYCLIDGKPTKLDGKNNRWIQGKLLSVVDKKTILISNGSKIVALDVFSTEEFVDNQNIGFPAAKLDASFRYTTVAGTVSQVEHWSALVAIPYEDFLMYASLFSVVKETAILKREQRLDAQYGPVKSGVRTEDQDQSRLRSERAAQSREFWRMK